MKNVVQLKNADVRMFMRGNPPMAPAIKDKFKALTGFSFVMELQRNKRLMNEFLTDSDGILEEPAAIEAYRKEHIATQEKFALHDDKGGIIYEPIPNDPSKSVPKADDSKKDEYLIAIEKVEKKYKKDVDIMNQKFTDYNELMTKPCEIDFYTVTEKALPKNISDEQMDLLSFMIELPIRKMKIKK